MNLSGYSLMRFYQTVGTSGAAGSVVRLKYSLDAGVTWTALTGDISLVGGGVKSLAWIEIPSLARQDILVSLFGQGGDGATDPSLGSCGLQLK
jgi:hypothetical protein